MGNETATETEQRRSIVIDFDGTITEDDLLDEIAQGPLVSPVRGRNSGTREQTVDRAGQLEAAGFPQVHSRSSAARRGTAP